jgi:Protein of unknown function (DUF3108)
LRHSFTIFALRYVGIASQCKVMRLRLLGLPAACAGVFLLSAALHPAAAAADVVKMAFEGFGSAGLHLLTTHTVIEETPAWYQIEGDFATAGLGALFVNAWNRSLTQGREVAGAPRPISFDSETDRDGAVQHLHVVYRADGVPNGIATPPPKEPVTPINFTQLPGTVDNLTAYFLLERQVARGGGCDLKVPVFDGMHRYDLQFSDAGRHVLSQAKGQNFAGPAQACHMVRHEIGGFYIDKNREEGASAGTIWYAHLMPGDLAVPVRMSMQTEIGNVALYLSKLQGRGVDLRLME